MLLIWKTKGASSGRAITVHFAAEQAAKVIIRKNVEPVKITAGARGELWRKTVGVDLRNRAWSERFLYCSYFLRRGIEQVINVKLEPHFHIEYFFFHDVMHGRMEILRVVTIPGINVRREHTVKRN